VDLEPQRPQFGSDGRLAAAEVGGLQRAQLRELITVRGTGDRLGVVSATIMKQVVLACPAEPIPLQEGVLADAVVLGEGLENCRAA